MTSIETSDTATEPVAAEPSARAVAGSSSSASPVPTPAALALRVLLIAALVAGSVASPPLGLLLVPIVPVLVALALLRGAGWGFVAGAAGASVAAAVAVAIGRGADMGFVAVAGAVALLATALLGAQGAHAAHPDEPDAANPPRGDFPAWLEPRLTRGFTATVLAWTLAVVPVAVALVLLVGGREVGDATVTHVRDFYATQLVECGEGRALASQTQLCDQLREQRDAAVGLADDHASLLIAVLAAIIIFGAAGTSHPAVLWRARALRAAGEGDVPVRPSYRLRELEVHWSVAYVAALGVVLLMVGDGMAGSAGEWTFAAGAGVTVLAAWMIGVQGAGLLAWIFTRRRMPLWYRMLLVLAAFVMPPLTAATVVTFGIFDLALHPRRRAPKAKPAGR